MSNMKTNAVQNNTGIKSELETFDGRDNRKEVMLLLHRLGTDERRAIFIESLIPSSLKGFAECPMEVRGACDPIAAYFMLVGVCNELGVSINEAARRLEKQVAAGVCHDPSRGVPRGCSDYPCGVCQECKNMLYDSDFH